MHRSIRALPALGAALLLAIAAAGPATAAMPTAASSGPASQHASASPTAAGHDHASMDDMDHGSSSGTAGQGSSGHEHGGSMPGMDVPGTDHTDTGGSVARPRTLVLGGFGALNAAVLVAAAVFRRRFAGERTRRRDARAAALATD